MGSNPKISILTPSYNHEKYVGHFIKSLLNQTEQDFELIIVDDNSTDKNVEEIKKIEDGRITLIQHDYNKGINAGLNSAFAKARGKYIVFIASDDMLEPNHLETCSKYLDENSDVDVFYCSLSLIDDNNNQITERENHYVLKPKNKYEVLKDLFLKKNSLLSPGMTIRKDAFEKIYPLDLSMVQFQDYAMNAKLLINGNAHLSEQKLVKYRQISSSTNISAKSSFVLIRERLEEENLLNSFLKMDLETLKNTFGNDLKEVGEPTEETIPYFLGRMALSSSKPAKKEWGYKTIMNFIAEKENFELLNKLYGFDFKQFIKLAENFEGMPQNLIESYESKISKYKKLFIIFLTLSSVLASLIVLTILGLIIFATLFN